MVAKAITVSILIPTEWQHGYGRIQIRRTTTIPKKKLSDDDALALVLSGLKGELPVSDLCRKYGVSTATYYKLRDQFIAGGIQGLQNNGKTDQVKALELRIKELEQALGRKTLEVEVLKKTEDFFSRMLRK